MVEAMYNETESFELKLYELDVLQEVLAARVREWRDALRKVDDGDESLVDLIDSDSGPDAEYEVEAYEKLAGRLGLAQRRHDRNSIEFIDEQQVYRPEQIVELFRIRGCGIDQVIYVFKSRHGVYFIYETLEALLTAFSTDKESKMRFECSKEVTHFLSYWRPRQG